MVWADQETWGFGYEIGFSGVKELLSWMVEKGVSLELFAYTAWSVWSQRNKAWMHLQVSPLHQVAKQARAMLAQYQANTQSAEMQVVSSGIGGTRWRPLQSALVKVNFDGTVFGNSNMSGIGAVIRNHDGAVRASCAEKLNQAYKAEEIEALVALKAL